MYIKLKYKVFILFLVTGVTLIHAQKIENPSFEQSGKQIIIYYDLTGTQPDQTFNVQVFCSTDRGKTFGLALTKVSGDVGSNRTGGSGKKIVWDVLNEVVELEGEIQFEVRILNTTKFGTFRDDRDGQIYKTVKIGTQVWMAENLKTTKYIDGTTIPLVTANEAWSKLTTPGYCWYDNDEARYRNTYEAMYNWYAVKTGKLCPAGWHVSTDAEWTTLTTYLGGESVAGGKLKATDTSYWASPNTGATNETGFSAFPGGYRHGNGTYYDVGHSVYWWSSTQTSTNAWSRHMGYSNADVGRNYYGKKNGFSVRCLRD